MFTRYWTGHLSIFNSPEDLGDVSKCKAYKEFDGGIASAKFISNSKVISVYLLFKTSINDTKTGRAKFMISLVSISLFLLCSEVA